MRQLERLLMLHVVDSHWVRHLTALDELREGIGLRAFAQRDPLVEYKREAFEMFDELKGAIAQDIARGIYFTTLVKQPVSRPTRAYRPGVPTQSATPAPAHAGEKVGRNDPCPCGSGRKYKNCCMRKEAAAVPAPGQASTSESPRSAKRHRRKKR
jgi:preprotein translocase subunit SecA